MGRKDPEEQFCEIRAPKKRGAGENSPHHSPHPKTASPTEAAGSSPSLGRGVSGHSGGAPQQDAPPTASPCSWLGSAWLRCRQQAFRQVCHSPEGPSPQPPRMPLQSADQPPAWLRRTSTSENGGLLHDCVGLSFP